MFKDTIEFIKGLYPGKDFISLHEPIFSGNEKKYVNEAIDSTFVSSVGKFVDRFENEFAKLVGEGKAIVTSNGTSALHAALHLLGVGPGDEVITQGLTFVATANAISYCGAAPIFIDSERSTLGMSPESLLTFLEKYTEVRAEGCFNKTSGKYIKVCVPMHVFGHPVRIDKIVEICDKYGIAVLEDAAEAAGSLYKGRHAGLFGKVGVYSFNGNKIITSGGGGLILTKDEEMGKRVKHLTTTAKRPHPWEFYHDEVGFNYRMPNLNAALAVGQLERLNEFVENKRATAIEYKDFFSKKGIEFVEEPEHARSNYWLNAVILESKRQRDQFLKETNESGVMTRPIWALMTELPMYQHCQSDELEVAKMLRDRVVNIPSSVRVK